MTKLTLESAQQSGLLEFNYVEFFTNIREILAEVTKIETETPISDKLKGASLAKLKIQHLSIDLVYLGYCKETRQPQLVFNVSKEINENMWITSVCSELRVTPLMFQDTEYLKRLMFRFLMRQAKLNKLSCFEYNN